MLATAIPPDQWIAFAEQFSRQHRGWLVTVEITETRLLDLGPSEVEVSGEPSTGEAPLQEIALDDSEAAGRARVLVGEGPNRLVFGIGRPHAVRFETTEDRAHQGLRIDDVDGKTIRIRFRAPALPEALDGIGGAEW